MAQLYYNCSSLNSFPYYNSISNMFNGYVDGRIPALGLFNYIGEVTEYYNGNPVIVNQICDGYGNIMYVDLDTITKYFWNFVTVNKNYTTTIGGTTHYVFKVRRTTSIYNNSGAYIKDLNAGYEVCMPVNQVGNSNKHFLRIDHYRASSGNSWTPVVSGSYGFINDGIRTYSSVTSCNLQGVTG